MKRDGKPATLDAIFARSQATCQATHCGKRHDTICMPSSGAHRSLVCIQMVGSMLLLSSAVTKIDMGHPGGHLTCDHMTCDNLAESYCSVRVHFLDSMQHPSDAFQVKSQCSTNRTSQEGSLHMNMSSCVPASPDT